MTQRSKYRAYEAELTVIQSKNENGYAAPKEQYIEVKVCEGDTLQAISIRYHCPVAELKRINNLHRENEIHAKKVIKVPEKYFSLVAIHRSGNNSPKDISDKTALDQNVLSEKLCDINTSVETQAENIKCLNESKKQDLFHEINLNKIIFDTNIVTELNVQEVTEFADEEVQLLPNRENKDVLPEEFNCSGADWGLSWPILLGIILVIAFVGPLIYIFYIAEHPEKYHHNDNRTRHRL